MTAQTILQKLEILADAAKYDASCASSGTAKRNSMGGPNGRGGIGSTEGLGICHAYAPDGRCISLLKILLTGQSKGGKDKEGGGGEGAPDNVDMQR